MFRVLTLSTFLLPTFFLTTSNLVAEDSNLTNLFVNASFEAPEVVPPDTIEPGADGWDTFNTAGVQTNIRHALKQALRLAPNAPSGDGDGIARQVYLISGGEVSIDTTYSIGAWIYNNGSEALSGTRKLQIRLQWFNANGFLINQQIADVADASTATDEWIFVSLDNVTIPDNENIAEVRAGFFVTNAGGTGGGPIYIDDVSFVQNAEALPGGNPRLLNAGFEFPDLVPPVNQAPGADDWITFNTAGVRTIFQHSGDQSLRLAPNAPTGTAHGICRQEFQVGTDIFVGQPYSLGAWVYNSSDDPITGPRLGQLRIQWFNANGVLLNQSIQNVVDSGTTTDQWIKVSLDNVVIPDNVNIATVRAALFVVNNGGTGSGALFYDDVTFTQGESSLQLGDINKDGLVNLLDVVPFVELITLGQFQTEADMNQDCSVNLLDVNPFVDFLSGG